MSEPLVIEIKGATNTGKSGIAQFLADVLARRFDVVPEVLDIDKPVPLHRQHHRIQGIADKVRRGDVQVIIKVTPVMRTGTKLEVVK